MSVSVGRMPFTEWQAACLPPNPRRDARNVVHRYTAVSDDLGSLFVPLIVELRAATRELWKAFAPAVVFLAELNETIESLK